jgi:hypothetical protein
VVVSLTSLTSMTESLSKLAPFTVRVNAVDPAGTFDGATDEIEGVVAEGTLGVLGVVVDEEVPPQPLSTRQEKKQRTTAASTERPTLLMGLGSFVLVFGGTSRLISFLPFAEPANYARRRRSFRPYVFRGYESCEMQWFSTCRSQDCLKLAGSAGFAVPVPIRESLMSG